MGIYEEAAGALLQSLKPYTKKGEKISISKEVSCEGSLFREVVFSKGNVNSIGNEKQGYLYLREDYTVVENKNLQRKIAKITYYQEIIFPNEKSKGIFAALQSEGDIERDLDDIEDTITGLNFLYKEGVKEAAVVKEIVAKIPELRSRSNELIGELNKKCEAFYNENIRLSEESVQPFIKIYVETLKLNFEKVKIIASSSTDFELIRNKSRKDRRKVLNWFNGKVKNPLHKTEYMMNYFIKILKTYESVLYMNMQQYVKFLSDIENRNIENRVNKIRKK